MQHSSHVIVATSVGNHNGLHRMVPVLPDFPGIKCDITSGVCECMCMNVNVFNH